MPFENHVFISYAHIDNRPLSGQKGWITRFHEKLEVLLSMRLGREVRIWRDLRETKGNDDFAPETMAQLRSAAVLVSVVTPRYLESKWCATEIDEFCRVAEEAGRLNVENASRVFKVFHSPVESQAALPDMVQRLKGYEFYTVEDDNTPITLDESFSDKLGQELLKRLNVVSCHAASLIKALENTTPPAGEAAAKAAPKATVYLAECSRDVRDARETLKGELEQHGYLVLPDLELPRDEEDYLVRVNALLARCTLAIHLVGTRYGAVPDGQSGKSVVVLQNDAAIAQSAATGLRRLLWLPAGTRSDQPAQQEFIDQLSTNADLQRGADVIAGGLESLKSAVHAALAPARAQVAATAAPHGEGRPLVYLICDERDRKATIPVRKYLRDHDVEVEIPLFEGLAAEVRQANDDFLKQCDGVLVFYGAGSEAWKHAIDSDLRRLTARRERPLATAWTLLASPTTAEKEELVALEEPNLINAVGGLSDSDMDRFVGALRRTS